MAQYTNNMPMIPKNTIRINRKTLRRWKLGYEYGDIVKLIRHTGYSRRTIERALKEGRANEKLAKDIDIFYAEKEQVY